MKNLLIKMVAVLAVICYAGNASAQQRIEVAKGVYIATYGNVSVIENDNTRQSVQIKVVKSDNMYNILCGNTVVKTVAKAGIRKGIAYAIQGYTTIPKWLTESLVGYVVDKVYDGVCNYYGSKQG